MAFQGMLGHLAHPVTTPVWGRDKCSAAPAICTQSGQRARTYARARAHSASGKPTLDVRKVERAESRSLYITALGALVHRDVWPINEGRNGD